MTTLNAKMKVGMQVTATRSVNAGEKVVVILAKEKAFGVIAQTTDGYAFYCPRENITI